MCDLLIDSATDKSEKKIPNKMTCQEMSLVFQGWLSVSDQNAGRDNALKDGGRENQRHEDEVEKQIYGKKVWKT